MCEKLVLYGVVERFLIVSTKHNTHSVEGGPT